MVPSLGCDRLSVSFHPLGKGVQDSKSKQLIKVHDFDLVPVPFLSWLWLLCIKMRMADWRLAALDCT